ncbi:spore germination protein [Bacillus sp. PK3_68]|uniref:spore germination protein n=1 Tax=Bacillus sp. PK3_68 TaxID=2027408 RepID=UPI000E743298|nr:spore germination protein [Bacillus sp. PK3_68]RJS61961.1 hypothetical protein CJ483_19505 [Bacillus sp. PK3_68]
MPFMVNIFNMKTNRVTSSGNIDVSGIVHNSHTVNTKFVGGNISLGDFSPSSSCMSNGVLDSDLSDQDQIANRSMPVANQF